MPTRKDIFGNIYHMVKDKEYQEYLEYKKWLNSPCCQLRDTGIYREESRGYSWVDAFYHETLEDIRQDDLGDLRTEVNDVLDLVDDRIEDLNGDVRTLWKELDKLTGVVNEMSKKLKAQILINKVKK